MASKAVISAGGHNFHLMCSYVRLRGFDLRDPVGGVGSNVAVGWEDPPVAMGNIIEDCIMKDPVEDWAASGVLFRRCGNTLVQRNRVYTTSVGTRGSRNGLFFWGTGLYGGNVIKENDVYSEGALRDCIGGAGNFGIENGPGPDSFIYDNNLYGAYDDALESEGGNMNVALFNNKCEAWPFGEATRMLAGIGLASVVVGPLYSIRNIVNSVREPGHKIGSSSWGSVFLYHNVIFNTGNGLVQNSGNNRIAKNYTTRNNIVHAGAAGRVFSWYDETTPVAEQTLDSDYNCLFEGPGEWFGFWYADTIRPRYLSLAECQEKSVFEQHSIDGNPLLADPLNGDFRLLSGSPCIDAGEVIPGINDADSPWPYQGNAPDIGALESGVAAAPPSVGFDISVQFLVATCFDLSTGIIASRLWDFGDGTTSSVLNPVHTYAVSGTYTITLTVTGPGGSDSASTSIDATVQTQTLTLAVTGNGTAVPAPGAHDYAVETSLSLEAIPDSGWQFSHWEGDVGGVVNPLEFLMPYYDISITAIFEVIPPIMHTVSIEVDGLGTTVPAVGSHLFAEGTVLEVAAVPGLGWGFDYWEGDVSGTVSPVSLTVTGDMTVRAVFKDLTIVPTEHLVVISIVGQGTTVPAAGSYVAIHGETMEITAAPVEGWAFDHWEGSFVSTENPVSFSATEAMSVVAVFTEIPLTTHTLTMAVTGSGTTSPIPGAHVYDEGTIVDITAIPVAGWEFTRWEGDLTGAVNPTYIILEADMTITAVFTEVVIPPTEHSVAISVIGQGTTSPAAGSHAVVEGNSITITAIPAAGWAFTRWEGYISSTLNPVSFDVLQDVTITAVFTVIPPITYTLTIAVTGSGTTDPAPGQWNYEVGTEVSIAAVPAAGWVFDHWEGNLTGTVSPATIIITGNVSIVAVFAEVVVPPTDHIVSISIVGHGTTVPAVGSHTIADGENLTLTAYAEENWVFNRWEGTIQSTNNPVTVKVDQDITVAAVFTEVVVPTHTVTIAVTGSGTTIPVPGAWGYNEGTPVSITAVPESGWEFARWEGDLPSTANPLTFTITVDISVTAVFEETVVEPEKFAVSISIVGQGSTAPAPGAHQVTTGATLTVTAIAAEGWTFDHWEGDLSGSTNPVSIVVTANMSIVAVFVEEVLPTPPTELTSAILNVVVISLFAGMMVKVGDLS